MIYKAKFLKYLKTSGRTDDVAQRVISLVEIFAEFQLGRTSTSLDRATEGDLDAFIEYVEKHQDQLPKHDAVFPSVKSYLWAIRYYYQFTENKNMEVYAAIQREKRIKRKPFPLKDFRGVHPDHISALAEIKITNINQLLKAGKTTANRKHLSSVTGIPYEKILELVKLSDLARLPGVKGIRARLYHDAGIQSIEKMASMQAEGILKITQKFVEETCFDGIPPLPAEVRHGISTAKSLPRIVEFE